MFTVLLVTAVRLCCWIMCGLCAGIVCICGGLLRVCPIHLSPHIHACIDIHAPTCISIPKRAYMTIHT